MTTSAMWPRMVKTRGATSKKLRRRTTIDGFESFFNGAAAVLPTNCQMDCFRGTRAGHELWNLVSAGHYGHVFLSFFDFPVKH